MAIRRPGMLIELDMMFECDDRVIAWQIVVTYLQLCPLNSNVLKMIIVHKLPKPLRKLHDFLTYRFAVNFLLQFVVDFIDFVISNSL